MLEDRYYLLDLQLRAAARDRGRLSMYFIAHDGIYKDGVRISDGRPLEPHRNPFDSEPPYHFRNLLTRRSEHKDDAYTGTYDFKVGGMPIRLDPTLPASMPLVAINPDPAYWGYPWPRGAEEMSGTYNPPSTHTIDFTELYEDLEIEKMSYRPITDVWILARPKVKYYGAYPAGFLSRARALLGVRPDDAVLHVCSGMVKDYPFAGFGPNDATLDGNPALEPTFCLDVTDESMPLPPGFAAILTDPPYTEEDATHYEGGLPFPSSSALMKKCLQAVEIGSRVGMLHYEWPACPDFAREVAVVGVTTGRRQRMRHFVVMERTA